MVFHSTQLSITVLTIVIFTKNCLIQQNLSLLDIWDSVAERHRTECETRLTSRKRPERRAAWGRICLLL